ncbi:MAG: C10 family peptidase, partial [Candidatus Cloacimonadaceae bacterium]|nr:C10 family peptidase [Candidatus Cloacimonadaceae bacterium]
MKKQVSLIILFLCVLGLSAVSVDVFSAQRVAQSHLARISDQTHDIFHDRSIDSGSVPLAHVFGLEPIGYIVVSADDALPPVIAYSTESAFSATDGDLLEELIRADLRLRLEQKALADDAQRARISRQWQELTANLPQRDFEQWPPAGYSPTQGWIKTLWTQNGPYNMFCPIDPVSGQRSLAGCPAVAMAQIVNYYQTINLTAFSDADDYLHNYAGRTYWIDDDASARDFPTWPELNTLLDTMMHHYRYQETQSDEDKAALVYALGVAAHQVYTSSGSGTFGVNQAFAAMQRFAFEGMELITQDSPEVYNRMAQNMMDAKPVLLAVVTPAWDSGHNVVVDGYNTDDFFHLNFGWGGSYNGWYLLPSQIPYNLTVLEGAIVDINPKTFLFAVPEVVEFTTYESVHNPQILEILNISDMPVTIEVVNPFPPYLGEAGLSCQHPALPFVLNPGQSIIIDLEWFWVDGIPRVIFEGRIEIIHSAGVFTVPMRIDTSFFYSGADDEVQTPQLSLKTYPNPFAQRLECDLKLEQSGSVALTLFNLRGQRVKSRLLPALEK